MDGLRNPAPVDVKHPMIYRVSTCFNHPFGGLSDIFHPQRHQGILKICQPAWGHCVDGTEGDVPWHTETDGNSWGF